MKKPVKLPNGQCCGRCTFFAKTVKEGDFHKCLIKVPEIKMFPYSVQKALNRVALPQMWVEAHEGTKCPTFLSDFR